MGGVAVTEKDLWAMQAGDHILHARNGALQKVVVHKSRLPLDPKGHVQILGLVQAPDRTIYAVQKSIVSKSIDGGKTWKHAKVNDAGSRWVINADGRFVHIRQHSENDLPAVFASDDEGQIWDQIGQIDVSPRKAIGAGHSMRVLKDGTLMAPIQIADAPFGEGETDPTSEGKNTLYIFRSEDGGRSFLARAVMGDWCSYETNIAQLPSGSLLAVIRYGLNPEHPELRKHVFLSNSTDGASPGPTCAN